jgi:hypothetical protein
MWGLLCLDLLRLELDLMWDLLRLDLMQDLMWDLLRLELDLMWDLLRLDRDHQDQDRPVRHQGLPTSLDQDRRGLPTSPDDLWRRDQGP